MIASAGAAAALFLTIYLLRLDPVAGLIVDDAWYLVLAKGLATGHGYSLINSPSPGILPIYPPAFPWLLSLVFRLAPQFPQNLWLLKSVSVLAMFGVGVASSVLLRRTREVPHYLALAIATTVTLTPAFTFLATSAVMSECTFMLLQLLAILVVERGLQLSAKGGSAWRYWVLAAALSSSAFLTRSVGLGLLVAVGIYLLKARRFKGAVVFTFTVIVLVGPWMAYARAHAPTPEQRAAHGGHIVLNYTTSFWQKKAGDETFGEADLADLPERVWNNLVQILGHDIGMIIAPTFLRDADYSGAEVIEQSGSWSWLSLLLSPFVVAGLVAAAYRKLTLAEVTFLTSLPIILLWPWAPYRFILPFAPFVIFYFLTGLRLLPRLNQRLQGTSNLRAQWLVVGLALGAILAADLYDQARYIAKKYQPTAAARPYWLRTFEENQAMLQWVAKRVPPESVITSPNPALVYLYTDHKTIAFTNPEGNWERWNRMGVRYLVRASIAPVPKPDMYTEARYSMPYLSRGELNLRVVDFGPAADRLPWGGTDPRKSRIKIDNLN